MSGPTSPPYVLAIDGGTESLRVGIFDLHGIPLAISSSSYTTSHPRPGWAEQDARDWWQALVAATYQCVNEANVDPQDIAGISADATTCTLVPLGKDNQPLRPALLWMDVRAADQAERIFNTGHRALSYSPAGSNAEWMLSKALWLRENEPDVYGQTAKFVEYLDWLMLRLTGRLALNLNTATQRWYYNSRDWRWPTDLFNAVGAGDLSSKIPDEILPPGELVGTLTPEAAEALGLSENTQVFQGGGDAFVGLLGLNVTDPGDFGLIAGSSNVLAGFVEEEIHGSGVYGAFPDAVIPGLWLVEAGQVSTGSILAWFKRHYTADLPSETAYEILDLEASHIPPGSEGLIVLDYFQGNRTPYTDSHARGAIWGLSLHTTRAHLFRALMEGVAYGTAHILEVLTELDSAPQRIYACGGATKSDLFMQIYADVCGVPISLTAVSDAMLLSGAILAAAGLGAYADMRAAAEAMVTVTKTFAPDGEAYEAYQFYFDQYKKTYPHLKDMMHEMTKHVSKANETD